MIAWYVLRKPVYLWQFVNIDGVGDVFVYPVRTSPFTSDPVFAFAHEAMRVMHWPIVVLAAIGSILVWLPRVSELLPESRGLVLRTGSLLLLFLAVATTPLNNPARFAVPVLPALFLMAMVLPVVLARWIGRKSRQSKPNSTGRQKSPVTTGRNSGTSSPPGARRLGAAFHPKGTNGIPAFAIPIETAVATTAIEMMRATVAMSSASTAERRWCETVKPILLNWADMAPSCCESVFPEANIGRHLG
jgi:hypothetical protein